MSWRDVIKVHPAAEILPPLGEIELRELVETIEAHGLIDPPILWEADKGEPLFLLDGRHRLDAMELAGLTVLDAEGKGLALDLAYRCQRIRGGDPYALVMALNIHRRHLTAQQKRELIAKLVVAQPSKSNRQIASQVRGDHKTVGKVRETLEGRGEVPHVATRTDTKGRRQPAHRPPPSRRSTRAAVNHSPADDMAAIVRKHGDGKPFTIRNLAWDIRSGVAPSYATQVIEKLAGEPIDGFRAEVVDSAGELWRLVPVTLPAAKVDELVAALHGFAGGTLDTRPRNFLASLATEVGRMQVLDSARAAHKWLGELTEAAR